MNRIKYVDMLKFVAILAVILLHVFAIGEPIMVPIFNVKLVTFGSFVKFGVPIFLMITGMLTLNKEIELSSFFKKKVIRIVFPLIFFFIIAYICNVYSTPLLSFWYCWMIIATYFAIPVINKLVQNSSLKEIRYFVLVFLMTSVIYTFANKYNISMHLDFNFFIGPVSYLVFGYYLSKREFNLENKWLICISLLLFILVSFYKIYIGDSLFLNSHQFMISYLDVSIFQVIQTSCVFIFIKSIYESAEGLSGKIRDVLESKYVSRFIESISRSSYGIYLIHIIILRAYVLPFVLEIPMTGKQACISIALVTTLMLLMSWIIIWILGKVPFINKFSGYY